jgi:ketosteroid isomerase-like protein
MSYASPVIRSDDTGRREREQFQTGTPARYWPPMPHREVEIVRAYYEAATRRDFDAIPRLLDPAIEFHLAGVFPDLASTYGGYDEVEHFLRQFAEPWDELLVEPEELLAVGSEILALIRFRARGRDGVSVELPLAHLWTLKDGRGVRMNAFADRDKALEAAGAATAHDNVEIVRRFYEAWSREDFPGPTELMDPEIEYVNPPGAIEPGTRRGIGDFEEAVGKLLESWEFWRAEPQMFATAKDEVAVVVSYRTRGRGSGVDVEGKESALWTLRDGKVMRYQWFHAPADAFEALGEPAATG